MAIDVSWEGSQGLYRKYSGTLEADDIIKANLKSVGDHRNDSLRYIIADFLEVTASKIDIEDISRVALFDQPATRFMRRVKIAFVLAHEAQHALAEFYQRESISNWQFAIFDTVEAARQWIAE